MIKVGIVGGSGYTAGELIRILINHNKVDINFIYSTTNAGNLVNIVHQDLVGSTDLKFTDKINPDIDVLFLCLGHGNSKKFLSENNFSIKTKIIDLSNDFRLNNDAHFQHRDFVYGLPELNKEKIENANAIANPGCFATAIQLALLPLAKSKLIKNDVQINAITGATGAGVKPINTTHFSYRDNNFSCYKPFSHQHLGEIKESLQSLQSNFDKKLNFLPYRGNFSRGIFSTIYTKSDLEVDKIISLYENFYTDAPFAHICYNDLHLKQVVNTNNCFINIKRIDGKLLIFSAIDNLIKGASGQAIQNMNIMYGLDECEGLQLKANYF